MSVLFFERETITRVETTTEQKTAETQASTEQDLCPNTSPPLQEAKETKHQKTAEQASSPHTKTRKKEPEKFRERKGTNKAATHRPPEDYNPTLANTGWRRTTKTANTKPYRKGSANHKREAGHDKTKPSRQSRKKDHQKSQEKGTKTALSITGCAEALTPPRTKVTHSSARILCSVWEHWVTRPV